MSTVRSQPCTACPYRRDVPSGVWAANEYDKLPLYDAPTGDQPIEPFACHATPEHYCHGWASVHSNRGHDRELLALRIYAPGATIPESPVALFDSGQAAAEHGKTDITTPTAEAQATVDRLLRKYDRLQTESETQT